MPDSVREVLARASVQNSYGAVAGSAAARAAAAGYYARRAGRDRSRSDRVRAGIEAAVVGADRDDRRRRDPAAAVVGQLRRAGADRRSSGVAGRDRSAGAAGCRNPPRCARRWSGRARASATPGLLVLTLPDNPTGTFASASVVAELVEIAQSHGLAIICDEIYRDLAHDPERARQPRGARARARVHHQRPEQEHGARRLADRLRPSARRAARPRRVDARWAASPRDLVEPGGADAGRRRACARRARRRDRRMSPAAAGCMRARRAAAHEVVTGAGAVCRAPTAAFYLYPDLEPLREPLAAAGVDGADALAEWLLERHEIGVLSGDGVRRRPAARCAFGWRPACSTASTTSSGGWRWAATTRRRWIGSRSRWRSARGGARGQLSGPPEPAGCPSQATVRAVSCERRRRRAREACRRRSRRRTRRPRRAAARSSRPRTAIGW